MTASEEYDKPEQVTSLTDEPELDPSQLPKGIAFVLIIMSTLLVTFIMSLDVTIVAPIIPVVSNQFHSLPDVTWYLSAYFATSTCFQAFFGPFYKLDLKWTYVVCILIFELGSLICAVAPNSNVFIGGRAVAGLGVAGAYVGTLAIIAKSTTLATRTRYSNATGGAYAVGAVIGPLLGGTFSSSQRLTWRFAFWINLPLGGLSLAAVIFCFHPPKKPAALRGRQAWITAIKDSDWIGSCLIFGSLICFLMAMQWGGVRYSWSDSRIIGLLVGFVAILVPLIPWCWFRQRKSILPPHIMRDRTVAASSLTNICIGGAYFSVLTFLAIYFQIRGSSPIRSGIQLLPTIAGVISGLVVCSILAGIVGYTPPFLYVGMSIFCIGIGSLVLFDENTKTATWAGCTFLVGFGSGMSWQMPFISSQTVVKPEDIEVSTACVVFTQTWGGALAFAANQAIYQNFFLRGVIAIPNLPNAREVGLAGVTAFRTLAPPEFVNQLEVLAIDSLRRTWYLCIALLGFAIIFFVPWIKWVSIKPQKSTTMTQSTKEEHSDTI